MSIIVYDNWEILFVPCINNIYFKKIFILFPWLKLKTKKFMLSIRMLLKKKKKKKKRIPSNLSS